MFRSVALALTFAVLLIYTPAARAGVYSDDLGKCLVKSTSRDDQTQLIVWLYTAMGTHPDIRTYSKVDDAQRGSATRRAADLYIRLITVDCRPETVAALKNEGNSSLESAFSLLGQVAMQGLMREPNVAHALSLLAGDFDKSKIQGVFTEAGIPSESNPLSK